MGNLHKEDFEILDRGKPQIISQFSAEQAESQAVNNTAAASVPAAADRFVIYVFDDVRLSLENLHGVRTAIQKHLESLRRSDRVAIAATSGKVALEFTEDRWQLRKAADRLAINPSPGASECPKLTYYDADRIENKRIDSSTVYFWAQRCGIPLQAAPGLFSAIARQQLTIGDRENRDTLQILRNLIRIMVKLPGQRIIVLISPGFITPHMEYEFSELVDEALRSQVVISTLDARGVFVTLVGENADEKRVSGEILAFLAEGTGGMFFHGSNDVDEGFRTLTAPPPYSYYLGFAPQSLKEDGKFHKLQVTVRQHFTIQARPGYYAPKAKKDRTGASSTN